MKDIILGLIANNLEFEMAIFSILYRSCPEMLWKGIYMLLHADFYVHSMTNSLKFYIDALGFKKIDDFEIEGDLVRFLSDGMHSKCRAVFLKFGIGKAMVELVEFLDRKTAYKITSRGYITILVPSIDEKICDLQRKNINPISDIFCVTSNRFGKSKIVFYSDLDDNKIEFLEIISS